jgi:dUTP pyrophosphatase
VTRLSRSAVVPCYAHPGDSGLDLSSAEAKTLAVGGRQLVRTGIAIEMPTDVEGQIRPRSGLAKNHGITVLNAPGTIDSGYRGEILVLLINLGDKEFVITRGMRIAQLVFANVIRAKLQEVQEISASKRGKRGFGSTGGYERRAPSGVKLPD